MALEEELNKELESFLGKRKPSLIERLADFFEKKYCQFHDDDGPLKRIAKKAGQKFRDFIVYAQFGIVMPGCLQEEYAKHAGFGKHKLSTTSICWSYLLLVPKALAAYCFAGHDLIASIASLGIAAQTCYAFFDTTVRLGHLLVRKRPIATLPVEMSFKFYKACKRKHKQKKN